MSHEQVYTWESRSTENEQSFYRQIKQRTTFYLCQMEHVWNLLDQTTDKRNEKVCQCIYLSLNLFCIPRGSAYNERRFLHPSLRTLVARHGNTCLLKMSQWYQFHWSLESNLNYKIHFQKRTRNRCFFKNLDAD